jgi:hypothetical protein
MGNRWWKREERKRTPGPQSGEGLCTFSGLRVVHATGREYMQIWTSSCERFPISGPPAGQLRGQCPHETGRGSILGRLLGLKVLTHSVLEYADVVKSATR